MMKKMTAEDVRRLAAWQDFIIASFTGALLSGLVIAILHKLFNIVETNFAATALLGILLAFGGTAISMYYLIRSGLSE